MRHGGVVAQNWSVMQHNVCVEDLDSADTVVEQPVNTQLTHQIQSPLKCKLTRVAGHKQITTPCFAGYGNAHVRVEFCLRSSR